MAMETRKGNLIVENDEEESIIKALKAMEGYCLTMRDAGKCDACVIAIILDDDGNNDCPFHKEQRISAPGDWEIAEQLYNGGRRIFKLAEWEELRRKVGKA